MHEKFLCILNFNLGKLTFSNNIFRPVPTIEWNKFDGELPKKRMKDLTSPESDYGKALIIDNVHPEDAGVYECRSQFISHRMHVSVTGMEKVKFLPINFSRSVLGF